MRKHCPFYAEKARKLWELDSGVFRVLQASRRHLKSASELAQSKTLRDPLRVGHRASVLECGGPPPLCNSLVGFLQQFDAGINGRLRRGAFLDALVNLLRLLRVVL